VRVTSLAFILFRSGAGIKKSAKRAFFTVPAEPYQIGGNEYIHLPAEEHH
jgi:hypothetical protein